MPDLKAGDSVMLTKAGTQEWTRIGLVLGWDERWNFVLVFWGEDFPCEEEYPEQLQVVG